MVALKERLLLEETEEPGIEEIPAEIEIPAEAPETEAPKADAPKEVPDGVRTDPDRVNALSGAINSQIASVYGDIDGLNGLIAMLRDEPFVPSRDEVIGLLDSIVDDRSVHVGMLQEISGLLSGRGGLVDAGSGIAAGEIAPKEEPAEAEGE